MRRTEPSRERGGEGFVETGRGAPGGLSLHGKTYCATYGINNVGGLNVYSQPENLILDAASSTGGVGYSLNLGAYLKYINEHHPLAQRFASVRNYDAAGGTVLNIDDHLRIGSGTGPTFKMEIAAVMPLHEEARDYRVHVWDIKSAKSSSVDDRRQGLQSPQRRGEGRVRARTDARRCAVSCACVARRPRLPQVTHKGSGCCVSPLYPEQSFDRENRVAPYINTIG